MCAWVAFLQPCKLLFRGLKQFHHSTFDAGSLLLQFIMLGAHPFDVQPESIQFVLTPCLVLLLHTQAAGTIGGKLQSGQAQELKIGNTMVHVRCKVGGCYGLLGLLVDWRS
jgi:hypothetical protein